MNAVFGAASRRRLFAFCVSIVLGATGASRATAAAAAPAAPTEAPHPAAGETLSSFTGQDADGKSVTVTFPKGSKTVLVFFSSTCPICHRMIPAWNRAYDTRDKGLAMYGIAVDKPDRAFYLLTEVKFPVLTLAGREFLDAAKVFRVPTTMRVKAGGVVEDVAQGQIDRLRLGQFFAP
jgi:peroxiredoxin